MGGPAKREERERVRERERERAKGAERLNESLSTWTDVVSYH
jgi:hypothetical protein